MPIMAGHRLVIAIAALVFAMGCAARGPAVTPAQATPVPPRTDDLVALIEQGCYRCLERAYEQAHARGATQQAFESAVLLVLRSKELGMPFAEWLAKARAVAPEGDDSALYLTIADALPPDRLSDERYALFEMGMRNVRGLVASWHDELRIGSGSDLFRGYLDLALVCAFGRVGENAESDSGERDPVAAAPLYQYAIGICDPGKASRLEALRAATPEFVDADYALGRYQVEGNTGEHEAGLQRLRAAAAAFPSSSSMPVWIGNTYRGWEEWPAALEAYDAALAVAPKHPDALIGRTIALSQMGRAQEAIAAATAVIDGGQWMVGEAYYWRAWNQLRLGNLPMARQDADRARTQMANARVFVLSGVIEWRMRKLETAERDFQQAVTIDFGECEGAFDLGIVRDELGHRDESLAAFRQARQCNDLSIKVRREAIATIEEGPGTPSSRARDASRHQRALAELEERRDEITRAIELLEKASKGSN